MTTATITASAAPPEPDRGAGPRWARPALYGLLLAVGLAYFSNLSASGYANSFYSAAVQAGSQSWKAFFFGSLDSANAITVDKPPAALWPMALSVRMFGLNSWAILAPQVLMALATAAVLNSAVRRRFGPVAGLIAVGVLALTPVAALMFRFNNPDALLALLMTVTVSCVLRALEQGRTKWLLWAGAAVGLAFLTKTLQAFLILPPLAVLYAVCAPVPVRKRIGQLALSALTMVVAGGWWVAIVELMPASSRPYVGGSQNNSFLELTFGYNGLGRINGEETGSVGGGGGRGGGGGWGETGIGRMFNSEVGGQIAWLLPAALILLVAGLWLTRKAGRTDSARAAFIAWGGALVMTAAVFSFMAGIFHQYYTVALAPYVAALVAMGAVVLWEERSAWWPRAVLAGTVLATVLWAYVLLGRTPDHLPWLRWAVLAGGIVGALGLLVVGRFGGRGLAVAVVGLSCAASLAGPTAYTVSTLNSGHQGSIVTAGPSAGFGMGGPGGGGPGGGRGGPGGPGGGDGDGGQRGGLRQQPPGQGQGQGQSQGQGNQQGNAPGGMPTLPGGGTAPGGTGTVPGFGEGMRGGGGGGMGGLLNGATVDAEAKALLTKGADDYTWVAAAVGAQNAASYQLATGEPVMAIGGFNGSDPSPTLAQFRKYVAEGKIHYFVSGGGMGGGGMGSSGTSSQITSWVTENFTEVTVGSATFYDLTQPTS
ncbi:glycosyltransferase family 39 protein [Streptomyces filamentosus]|uniref:Glycosyltransferase family 39 protein n=3 Tax=Streptomyces TaxID=1883 RepID=A0ABY4UVH5_STRFL|nr:MULTISPECIES: glycosyltransferase family 39 protein [Streptomyces]EFE76108.1 integral membrane protein [Streptomyces filamentosus NRRL 15998]EWS93105.1 integral membrane protein [Streptomyces filamentosus NRRL 11379]MYR80127.1 glycosyl transferase [Streptomyces sp. SID5466]USC48337.1 glycosyltransferase family 39 protein [Streptomyces filamentosus]